MALSHAQACDVISVRPLGERLHGEKSSALFKSEQLEVIRVVLPAGKAMPPHSVAGEVTVQCIEGELDVTADGHSHVLHAGEMLFLPGSVSHAVIARQDASALVTIVLATPHDDR